MKHFDVILWDVDGTLLNFLEAEKAAIRSLFSEFGLGACTDEMLGRYSGINRKYWNRLGSAGRCQRRRFWWGGLRNFLLQRGLSLL